MLLGTSRRAVAGAEGRIRFRRHWRRAPRELSGAPASMFRYYFRLGLRSLRRNMVLTGLMIAAIAVGIGACMTALTVFRAMSGDPIPQKSSQLYTPQIDNWSPERPPQDSPDGLADAAELYRRHGVHAGARGKTPSRHVRDPACPCGPTIRSKSRSKPTCELPIPTSFRCSTFPSNTGAPGPRRMTKIAAAVVVLTREMNDRLFGGQNSVGKTVRLDSEPYTVTGVLDDWQLLPRFYDLQVQPFGRSDEIFMPYTRAIEKQMKVLGSIQVQWRRAERPSRRLLRSECVWLQFWVELPTAADAAKYRAFLNNYAAEQQRLGRFHWPPHTQLRNVTEWLQLPARRTQRGAHPDSGVIRISAGVPDECHGADARENHGPRGRYRRAPRARRQPRRDFCAVPDRDRRGRTRRRNIGAWIDGTGTFGGALAADQEFCRAGAPGPDRYGDCRAARGGCDGGGRTCIRPGGRRMYSLPGSSRLSRRY